MAVVIGNRNYQRREIPSVEYAHRDAEAVREYLVKSFGFSRDNIIFEQDATYTTLQRIFGTAEDSKGRLYSYASPDSTSDVFVFFSGHGAPDLSSGTPYIVPADADPQLLRLTGYPLRQLYQNLSKLPARSVTVLIDACFSGISDRGALLRGASPIGIRLENPLLVRPGAVVITASAANEVSGWLDQQQHGLLTYVFLRTVSQQLRSGVPAVAPSAREIGATVAADVLALSRRYRDRDQNPQVYGTAVDEPLLLLRPRDR